MESQAIRIEQVVAPRTWNIRQRILYPDGSLKDVQIDDDFEGTHFAAYLGDEIVGVISVFRYEDLFQFRKFAVLKNHQHKGIGSQLLLAVFEFCRRYDAKAIWCNSRLDAMAFYEKFGMQKTGDTFTKNNIRYVRMELIL
ncbi:GNAT family N-acetyltransferase [Sphingobacterium spiritivorum]|uniref:GNAT family N-acetyltransferase n=1 Tax=Sphingobacterium spiritivorum TaxID=258 RepID=UPI001917BD7E|nr:GNAT family N-acetyltransferase [Sphingobacterium spiritivorum]QQT24639.1 GNAT family N-acetyltransferase [Sphingobacterium spiritivorum]